MKIRGSTGGWDPAKRGSAFTLIELMIVVGVIGLIALIGIPAIYHAMHPESMQAAINDVVDGCAKARARAIWESKPVELRFIPVTGHFDVMDVPVDVAPVDPTAPPPAGASSAANAPANAVPETTSETAQSKPSGGISGQISDRIHIDMLDVNFRECKDEDEARVCFYPNGTCDEFTIILHSLETGESKRISLDLVTAMPTVTEFP